MSKYTEHNLLPPLRLFVGARNKAVEAGFTDNGGAIHSVERIVDILGLRVRYPHLSHINDLKQDPDAEISVEAHKARERGEAVRIEHVQPKRHFAREIIRLVNEGADDDKIVDFIRRNYRLVLLTPDETARINRLNRTGITDDRVADTGIELFSRS